MTKHTNRSGAKPDGVEFMMAAFWAAWAFAEFLALAMSYCKPCLASAKSDSRCLSCPASPAGGSAVRHSSKRDRFRKSSDRTPLAANHGIETFGERSGALPAMMPGGLGVRAVLGLASATTETKKSMPRTEQ